MTTDTNGVSGNAMDAFVAYVGTYIQEMYQFPPVQKTD